jgi:hypothetical protein
VVEVTHNQGDGGVLGNGREEGRAAREGAACARVGVLLFTYCSHVSSNSRWGMGRKRGGARSQGRGDTLGLGRDHLGCVVFAQYGG